MIGSPFTSITEAQPNSCCLSESALAISPDQVISTSRLSTFALIAVSLPLVVAIFSGSLAAPFLVYSRPLPPARAPVVTAAMVIPRREVGSEFSGSSPRSFRTRTPLETFFLASLCRIRVAITSPPSPATSSGISPVASFSWPTASLIAFPLLAIGFTTPAAVRAALPPFTPYRATR